MEQTFQLRFATGTSKTKSMRVKDAKADLSQNDFDTYIEKIIDSTIFNTPELSVTGIRSGELVTTSRVKYA